MYLKWSKECYLCECPLEPCIHTNTTEERILIRKYRKIRPIFTVNNDMYLKFFGTEVKRVCYACYINSYKVGITTLRDRECGRIKNTGLYLLCIIIMYNNPTAFQPLV